MTLYTTATICCDNPLCDDTVTASEAAAARAKAQRLGWGFYPDYQHLCPIDRKEQIRLESVGGANYVRND